MRRRLSFGVVVAMVVCGVLSVGGPVWAQGLHLRMQAVTARFVEQTGHQVLGVGSWIRGTGFNPARSDFDMKLVMHRGSSQVQMRTAWLESRRRMVRLIRQEFGPQANNVLLRTNLYPPGRLMTTVRNNADALGRYTELRQVPNLGHTGPVTSATPVKYTEGLYGQGAAKNIRNYEAGAGRFFYMNGGRCTTGMSEMAYLRCPEEAFTISGTANTAGQWAAKGIEELAGGRSDSVLKYLVRVEQDIIKSRSLAGMPVDKAFRTELRGMCKLLKGTPQALPNVADDVARLLIRARTEAAILRSYGTAGPVRRGVLRVLLDGVAAKSEVGKQLSKAMKVAGKNGVTPARLISFIVVCFAAHETSQKAGEGDTWATLAATASHLKFMSVSGFGPLLLTELMIELRIEAEATGVQMCANTQEAWDLMQGIYTIGGRVSVDPDQRRKLSLSEMVTKFQYEEKLRAVVRAHALRASDRGMVEGSDTLTGAVDAKVANATFARCWPVIRNAWLWERDALMSEYLQLYSEVVHTPLLIYYSPKEPEAGTWITCEARSFDGKLGERLLRMKEIMRVLYGRGSGITTSYFWEPDGASMGGRDWQRSFTFDTPGKHPVIVRLAIGPYTEHTKTNSRMMQRREVAAAVDVTIPGETKPDQAPGEGCWVLTKREVKAGPVHEEWEYGEPEMYITDPEDEGPEYYGEVPRHWGAGARGLLAGAQEADGWTYPYADLIGGRAHGTLDVQMEGSLALRVAMSWGCVQKYIEPLKHEEKWVDGKRIVTYYKRVYDTLVDGQWDCKWVKGNWASEFGQDANRERKQKTCEERGTVKVEWSPLPERIHPEDEPQFWLTAQYALAQKGGGPELHVDFPGDLRHRCAVFPESPTFRHDGPLFPEDMKPGTKWETFQLPVWIWSWRDEDEDFDPLIVGGVTYTYTWDPTGNTLEPVAQ